LQILAFGGGFVSINSVFGTLLRVKKRIKSLIFVSTFTTIIILGGSYLLMNKGLGLLGIGYAWLIGQGVISVVYLLFFRR